MRGRHLRALADVSRNVRRQRKTTGSGDDGTRTHDPLLAKQVL
jgi:hypothetical protein